MQLLPIKHTDTMSVDENYHSFLRTKTGIRAAQRIMMRKRKQRKQTIKICANRHHHIIIIMLLVSEIKLRSKWRALHAESVEQGVDRNYSVFLSFDVNAGSR